LASAPPYLLLEEYRRKTSRVQPDAVLHVAVNDDGPAFDHADSEPISRLGIFILVASYIRLEDECLAGSCALAAGDDPLVVTTHSHDDVAKDAHGAFRRLRQSVSLLSSAIEHAAS
jgi:hypothetical protein